MKEIEKIFEFLHLLGVLKKTFRYKESGTGKTERQESVAEHSWRLALMSWVIVKYLKLEIDTFRVVMMVLIHDLPEIVTDDIDHRLIVQGRVTVADKREAEYVALMRIIASLPDDIAIDVYKLWHEFEEGQNIEARLARAMDKFEAMFHICEMGHEFFDNPSEIPVHADEAVTECPELTPILARIKKEIKEEFEKGEIPWSEDYDFLPSAR